MKQVGKILEMVLVVSLCLGTSAVFAMQDDGQTFNQDDGQGGVDTNSTTEQFQQQVREEIEKEIEKVKEKEKEDEKDKDDEKGKQEEERTEKSSSVESSTANSNNALARSSSFDWKKDTAWITKKCPNKKAFFAWVGSMMQSPKCKMVIKVIGITAFVYVALQVWTAATVYCATESVDAISAVLVCPVVGWLNWVYAGITGFMYGLYASAMEFIKTHCNGEFCTNTSDTPNTNNNSADFFADDQGNIYPNQSLESGL